jgi:hypothetical protein
MKFTYVAIFFFLYIKCFSQNISDLSGRWCFTGLRTTVFDYRNEQLYVGLLESTDTLNFKKFLKHGPLDTALFTEAGVTRIKDTFIIEASFPKFDHSLKLMYIPSNPDVIIYTGDVFFDSSNIIVTNKNCQLQNPSCINKLYSKDEILTINNLKTPDKFSRDDAFEFLLRLSTKLKDKCNRCFAGFTDAYMNEVLIDMGFNPITRHSYGQSNMYNTSGYTFFLKTRFENDKKIKELSHFLLDEYINQP